jgi:hypothetical protein
MRTWNLSHRVRLTDDKQVLDFSNVVLGVSFNGTPVTGVSEVYMMRNCLWPSHLTTRKSVG